MAFNGLGTHLGNLWRVADARTRSISPENPDGAPGGGARAAEGVASHAARDLGAGWKVSPYIRLEAGERRTIADIEGPGAIQHIWMTPTGNWRWTILRIYWDDQPHPSVECPVGDFFAAGWGGYAQVSSIPVAVNPGSAFNCYWEMPFHRRCRIEVENLAPESMVLYFQIDYALAELPEDAACFHASFRRSDPVEGGIHTILDGVEGQGQYVGTALCWQSNSSGWWGEGEVKFYLDDDGDHPTICGTGTEDYFGGSYNFDTGGRYQEFTTPYLGMPRVDRPDGLYRSQTRFQLYRWHIADPIRFRTGLRATVQALGWRSGGRYHVLRDDLASVAYWYQTLPSRPLRPLPDRDGLEIV